VNPVDLSADALGGAADDFVIVRIAQLIEAIHQPGADIPALFRAHDSEILPAL